MCGIAGYIDFNKKADEGHLVQMTDSLSYRGPDSSGHELFQTNQCNIGLGHRRLSIIDLSPLGHQPMFTDDRNQVIIFNGEIYNYQEIQKELIDKGYSFRSHSDTEVILKAYLEWGAACLEKFIGMFAIVIYDQVKQQVFISRDRAGVKPVYYYWHNNVFLFGSELKAFFNYPGFEKEIDPVSVQNFLQYSYVPAPFSIFRNTWKLEPGQYLVIDLESKKIKNERYWNVLDYYNKEKLKISEEDALAELEAKLRKACEYRMVSDVPVGIFLSGGYDSSLVTAMLQTGRTDKLKTFTIGFKEKGYDEAGHAKQVATHLGTDHLELYCTFRDAQSIIQDLPDIYDEPIGAYSAISTILLSRMTAKHVKVALSADGGDEVFAGYERHKLLMQLDKQVASLPKALRAPAGLAFKYTPGKIMSMLSGRAVLKKESRNKYGDFMSGNLDLVDLMREANKTEPDNFLKKISKASITERALLEENKIRELPDHLSRLLAYDFISYLPNEVLAKVDRATMSASLEGREPLLDHKLIEWAATLPSELKLQNGKSKYLLRKIVHKYLPLAIMERPKMGFNLPLAIWFQQDLGYLLDEVLSSKNLAKHNLFNDDIVQHLIQSFRNGDQQHFQILWNMLVFQMWFNKSIN